MKSFLNKYKASIIFWIIFLVVVLYLSPKQQDYYLDNDIKNFKTVYLVPVLIWTGVILSVLVFVWTIATTKSIIKGSLALFSIGFILAAFLFIFQDLFLGASLFLNRLREKDNLHRTYIAGDISMPNSSGSNLQPYDLEAKHFIYDKKLISRINIVDKKPNDTIVVNLKKGLLGIPFDPRQISQ